MTERAFLHDDTSWLAMADRYVAEAQAEWVATMTEREGRSRARRERTARRVAAKAASSHLVLADSHIAATEKRLADQAKLIGQLAAARHDTSRADDQFWAMGQLLDAMRERRQVLAEGEDAP